MLVCVRHVSNDGEGRRAPVERGAQLVEFRSTEELRVTYSKRAEVVLSHVAEVHCSAHSQLLVQIVRTPSGDRGFNMLTEEVVSVRHRVYSTGLVRATVQGVNHGQSVGIGVLNLRGWHVRSGAYGAQVQRHSKRPDHSNAD